MTIKEFLQGKGIGGAKTVPCGKASTPQELFEDCITVPNPSDPNDCQTEKVTKAIIGWHELLSWYAEQDEAVLLSRLYESERKSGNWDNRRNSLTLCGNYRYAFCSNHFARVIMSMALNGFVPSQDDFWKMMVTDREFYLSSLFGLTPVEKRINAYSLKPYNAKFYTPGWYLAHIISVKDMPCKGHQDIDVKSIFELGDESEWSRDSSLGCMVRRKEDRIINSREKEVAKAHFLRCLDPINYFLVPNNNNVIYKKINSDDGSPLGENRYVVQFMLIKALDRFGSAFIDFLSRSLADLDIGSVYSTKAAIASAKICAEFAPGINATASAPNYTENEKLETAAYYLRNKVGLIDIEKSILKVSNKRGWEAKRILNECGIDTTRNSVHRGLLINSDIDVEISRATGLFKTTLQEIKKRGL